jgi:hypothetical protein
MTPIRTYDAATLINLPKQNANGLVALLKAVLAVKNAPGSLKKPQSRLKKALKQLQKAQAQQAPASSGEQRAADDAEDTLFRAVYQWLHGWSLLGSARSKVADGLLACLYPDDSLHFIQLAYREEWAEADTRMQRLTDQSLASGFKQLGGEEFLTRLHAVHAAYGKVLNITREDEGDETDGAVSIADAMAVAEGTLRDYVLKVSALADPDKVATQKLVARLLKPVTEAQSATRNASAPATPPAPAPAPAPQ